MNTYVPTLLTKTSNITDQLQTPWASPALSGPPGLRPPPPACRSPCPRPTSSPGHRAPCLGLIRAGHPLDRRSTRSRPTTCTPRFLALPLRWKATPRGMRSGFVNSHQTGWMTPRKSRGTLPSTARPWPTGPRSQEAREDKFLRHPPSFQLSREDPRSRTQSRVTHCASSRLILKR